MAYMCGAELCVWDLLGECLAGFLFLVLVYFRFVLYYSSRAPYITTSTLATPEPRRRCIVPREEKMRSVEVPRCVRVSF